MLAYLSDSVYTLSSTSPGEAIDNTLSAIAPHHSASKRQATTIEMSEPLIPRSSSRAPCEVTIDEGTGTKLRQMTPLEVVSSLYYDVQYYPYTLEDSLVREVGPLQRNHERKLPPGWYSRVAADGRIYFLKDQASEEVADLQEDASAEDTSIEYTSQEKRHHPTLTPALTLTLTDIQCDPAIDHIQTAMKYLHSQMSDDEFSDSKDTELVLALGKQQTMETVVGYYFADWKNQVIFWLEKGDPARVCEEGRATVSGPHLELGLRAEFWIHAGIFTNHRVLPKSASRELRQVLIARVLDTIAMASAAVAAGTSFNDTIMSIPDTLLSALDQMDDDVLNPTLTLLASRTLQPIYAERFRSFWGEPGAQLGWPLRTFGIKREASSWLFGILSTILFCIPKGYLRKLQPIFDGNKIHYQIWKRSHSEIEQHWRVLVGLATILVSANLGFITVTGLGVYNGFNRPATPIQFLAYAALLLDFFVIAACRLLKNSKHPNEMLRFLYNRRANLERIAFVLSFPGVCFFLSVLDLLAMAGYVVYGDLTLVMRIVLVAVLGVLLIMLGVVLLVRFVISKTSKESVYACWMDKFAEDISPRLLL